MIPANITVNTFFNTSDSENDDSSSSEDPVQTGIQIELDNQRRDQDAEANIREIVEEINTISKKENPEFADTEEVIKLFNEIIDEINESWHSYEKGPEAGSDKQLYFEEVMATIDEEALAQIINNTTESSNTINGKTPKEIYEGIEQATQSDSYYDKVDKNIKETDFIDYSQGD